MAHIPPPCSHVREFCATRGKQRLRCLLRAAARVAVPPSSHLSDSPRPVPRCVICHVSHGRLYACLACAAVLCCKRKSNFNSTPNPNPNSNFNSHSKPNPNPNPNPNPSLNSRVNSKTNSKPNVNPNFNLTSNPNSNSNPNPNPDFHPNSSAISEAETPLSSPSPSSLDSHVRNHAETHQGHTLLVDVSRAELFCAMCHDQVYLPFFDRSVLYLLHSSSPLSLPSSPNPSAPALPSQLSKEAEKGQEFVNTLTTSTDNCVSVRKRKRTCLTSGQQFSVEVPYRPWVSPESDRGNVVKPGKIGGVGVGVGGEGEGLGVGEGLGEGVGVRGGGGGGGGGGVEGSVISLEDGVPLGLRGMNNLGATCFMAAVLQALLHTPPMRNAFLAQGHTRDTCHGAGGSSPLCLACDMDAMFSAAFSGIRTPLSPAQFLYSWWRHAENIAGYEQQDAHEFFISTIDGIHANAARHEGERNGEAECQCIVHRVFSGLLRSDVTCTVCGFTSTTHDPCVDISLDLEMAGLDTKGSSDSSGGPPATLSGCLERFTRQERLDTSEKFFCQRCQTRQESVKQMSVRRLPLVLCLHIKRFEHSSTRKASRKLDRHVRFPFRLNMGPYLSSTIVRLRHGNRIVSEEDEESQDEALGEDRDEAEEDEKEKEKEKEKENAKELVKETELGKDNEVENLELGRSVVSSHSCDYELFAVVSHVGRLDSGHYICFVRLEGDWFKCDDAWVTRVDKKAVQAAQAYLLYYVRRRLAYTGSQGKEGEGKEGEGREAEGNGPTTASSSKVEGGG